MGYLVIVISFIPMHRFALVFFYLLLLLNYCVVRHRQARYNELLISPLCTVECCIYANRSDGLKSPNEVGRICNLQVCNVREVRSHDLICVTLCRTAGLFTNRVLRCSRNQLSMLLTCWIYRIFSWLAETLIRSPFTLHLFRLAPKFD